MPRPAQTVSCAGRSSKVSARDQLAASWSDATLAKDTPRAPRTRGAMLRWAQ